MADECPPNLTGADMYALCADALLNAMRTKIEHLEAGNYVFVEVFYTCNYVEIYVNYIHI